MTGARATTMPDGTPAYWVGLKGARPWMQSNAQISLHYSPAPSTHLSAGFALAQYAVGYARPDSFLRNASGAPVSSGNVSFADGATRRLSLSRALAVRTFLIDNGVRSTRIDVRALGDKAPDEPANRVDVSLSER